MQRAAGQLVHLVGDGPHESRIVLDQQHRLAGAGEPAQHRRRRRCRLPAIEPADRLIQQQHQRIGDERAGEFDQSQRAGGQLAGGDVGHLAEPELAADQRRPARARPGSACVLKACSSPKRCRFSAATSRFSRTVRVWKTLPT